jgi:propionyl-CoA carboxylase alpha chain
VTEEITGLDLVRLQIEVAEGRPLSVRQEDVRPRGHAIEVRIYAEDPRNDFLPSTGRLACWEQPEVAGIRWESGVETGSEVTIHYDPMLAKVIAHAPSRDEAALRLAKTLASMRVHGVRTNLSLLIGVLRHPAFLAGRTHTHFLGTEMEVAKEASAAEVEADRLHAVAAALWLQERRRAAAPVLRGLPSGWRNNPSRMQDVTFRTDAAPEIAIEVEYQARRDGAFDVRLAGGEHVARVESWDEGGLVLALDDVQRRVALLVEGLTCHAHSSLGLSTLHEVPRFPTAAAEEVHGGCRAPMPGKILAVRVAAGDTVTKGQPLVVLEAMKMEHEVTSPSAGTVEQVLVAAGEQVEAGAVLVVLGESGG